MASSSHNPDDGGFATAAAMTVSMGLAMIAAGLTVASVAELKRTRLEFAKTKTEYALQQAHVRAVADLLINGATSRSSWRVDTDAGQAVVMAEPEYAKASFAKAADLDDKPYVQLGVRDPEALKGRLTQTPPAAGGQSWIASLDAAGLWRACAPSLISRFGRGDTFVLAKSTTPTGQGFSWRPGEVWRVRTSINGWADDRIVRFTSRDQAPALTLERRFIRRSKEEDQCESLFSKGA